MTATAWHLFGGGIVVFVLVWSGLRWLERRNKANSLRFEEPSPPPPPKRLRERTGSRRHSPRAKPRRRSSK